MESADLESLMVGYQNGDLASATALIQRLSPQLHRFFMTQSVSRKQPMTCCKIPGYESTSLDILTAPANVCFHAYMRSPATCVWTTTAACAVSRIARSRSRTSQKYPSRFARPMRLQTSYRCFPHYPKANVK